MRNGRKRFTTPATNMEPRRGGSARVSVLSFVVVAVGAVFGFFLFRVPQKNREEASTPLGNPTGITSVAVDGMNRIYLGGEFGVKILTPDRRILREWKTKEPVVAIDGDTDGNVYVAYQTKVEKFDREGKSLLTWGKGGCEGDPFGYVSGIDEYKGNVFTADAGSRVVFRFTRDGEYLNQVGDKERDPDRLGLVLPTPFLDCYALDDVLYVNNPGKTRVEKYDFEGNSLGFWGKGGAKEAEFPGCCNPTNVTLFKDGRAVVSLKGEPCVKLYGPDGAYQGIFGRKDFPEDCKGIDLATDDAGRIYAVDKISGRVRVFKIGT